MPEFKRNFSQAKMNKDMDERLVPAGQYRDAKNVQISTSDDSNVGSLQTLYGNVQKNTMDTSFSSNANYDVPTTSTCVGSIAVPDTDKIYYFVSAGINNTTGQGLDIRRDYILEYNAIQEILKYVFVDIYYVKTTVQGALSSSPYFAVLQNGSSTINKTGIRIGMYVTGTLGGTTYTRADNITVTDIRVDTSTSPDTWRIYTSENLTVSNNDTVEFLADRVLNFKAKASSHITAINVIDDLLFWTDGYTEPKKINIKRSIEGTGGVAYLAGGGVAGYAAGTPDPTQLFYGDTNYFHTRLVADVDSNGLRQVVTNRTEDRAQYVEEEHITVIKKSPTQPLELDMSISKDPRIRVADGLSNPKNTSFNGRFYSNNVAYQSGDLITGITFDTAIDFRQGDILLWTNNSDAQGSDTFDNYEVRTVVESSPVTDPDNLFSTSFDVRVLSIDSDLPDSDEDWFVRLEDGEPLFEFKFVRFSYRYKYQDGEYSTFAPWSQIAFIPGDYEYKPKKGYNLGMRNQLRNLKLKGYHPELDALPRDVVEIDLLYKETNDPTVYTVKTIKPTDGHPIWPDLNYTNAYARGEYEIKSELVHAVVPSNQLLRPWDNVPRTAKAQEISANRLIYGNYLQNYTALEDPKIKVLLHSQEIKNLGSNSELGEVTQVASLKSMRTYQVGVVYSDGYGRETPVLTSKDASIDIPKEAALTRNRLNVRLDQGTNVPDWAKYFSWYVKETSTEYYTLAMDRWYHAADGNIWLSFPSSERNKLDEETFLILKKEHGSGSAVKERARYKILAIEDEAPDFIKTEKKSLGLMPNTSNTQIGNGVSGFPMPDEVEIEVEATTFESTFGSNLPIQTPDRLSMRIWGPNDRSEIYEVVKISGDSSTPYKIKIKGKFGEEMEFTSTGGTYATAITGLQLELIEDEVENKPEFDGRFFVKIYRDSVLNKRVVETGGGGIEDYFVSHTWKLRYLNNNAYKHVQGGVIGMNAKQKTDRDGSDHPTKYSHFTGSAYEWGGGTSGSRFGVENSDMADDSCEALNNDSWLSSGSTDARQFWEKLGGKRQFFIDACSAYQWTGHTDMIPGDKNQGTGTHNIFGGTNVDAQNEGPGAPDRFGHAGLFGNAISGAGPLSRGIWDGGRKIDISWTGMGKGYDGGNWSDRPFDHTLQDCANNQAGLEDGIFVKAATFIERLTQEGTKFRFRNDPDETVYTVSEYNYPTYSNYTTHPFGSGGHFLAISRLTGHFGIRNYKDEGWRYNRLLYEGACMRQKWTIEVDPPIGSKGPNFYNPVTGTINGAPDSTAPLKHDTSSTDVIEILSKFTDNGGRDNFSEDPAIWETEPKESVDMDIYYQASGLIPLELNSATNEELLPLGSNFSISGTKHTVDSWSDQTLTFSPALVTGASIADGADVYFNKREQFGVHYSLGAKANGAVSATGTTLKLHGGPTTVSEDQKLYRQYHILDWSNCWTFGNGVESDRIRDDYNAKQVDNGVKASTVLAEPIKEERREHGLIYSGIYNSINGVNETNQFIAAEAITKDLNPIYGSIQKLYTRPTQILAFCEDKVIKILTNRDALYNADGSSNVSTSNKVLGSASAYSGDWGISKNPESFVATPQQIYFADIIRGQVLALSGEGVRSISDLGMKDYFADELKSYVWSALGTYDEKKHEYNLTFGKKYSNGQKQATYTTVSYSERAKGWSSFKSFTPENGLSLNNDYYTFYQGQLWKHHDSTVNRNSFYGAAYESDITILFNDTPEAVKSFNTVNYEGTQARIYNPSTTSIADAAGNSISSTAAAHNEYFNLSAKTGWYIPAGKMITDKQTGRVIEFKEKEGKWFGVTSGETTELSNLDEREFTVQGLGNASFSFVGGGSGTDPDTTAVTLTFANNTSSSYVGIDGSGGAWDSSSVVSAEGLKWTVADVTQTQTVGATVSGQNVDLVITPIINGIWSGYVLTAADFQIGGASETSSGSGVWNGGNVDSPITGVTFTDLGIAGDPANTVRARVAVGSFTCPTSNTSYYIDIDEESAPIIPRRDACLRTYYPYYSTGHTVSITSAPTGLGNSVVDNGVSSGTTKNLHSGTVTDNVSTKIAEISFTASSGYKYEGWGLSFNNLTNGGVDYSSQYNYTITPTTSTAGTTKLVYKIYYTPGQTNGLSPDPPSLCELNHIAQFQFVLRQNETFTNKITRVSYPAEISHIAQEVPVTVRGASGSEYTIRITQHSDPVKNTIAKYYDFTENEFETLANITSAGNSQNLTTTVGSSGLTTHHILIPGTTTAKVRYDIVLSAGSGVTLASGVPTNFEDASITQYGINTVTLQPKTHNHTSNFGAMPSAVTIKAPIEYGEKTFGGLRRVNFVETGGNGGSSGTTITLTKENPKIQPGMYVLGTGITYGVTVSSVRKRTVTISTACSVANGTTLTFERNTSAIIAFDFTVTPTEGRTLSISSGVGRQPTASDVGGFDNRLLQTNGVVTESATVVLDDTDGAVAGMTVTGTGVASDTTVSSVTNATTLVLSKTNTIADNESLSFYSNHSGIKVIDISAVMSGSNTKVQGLLHVGGLGNSETATAAHIYIDNFINNS